jgi:hypothetical protein
MESNISDFWVAQIVVENPKVKMIATRIPISGDLNDRKTSGWQTFVVVLKMPL